MLQNLYPAALYLQDGTVYKGWSFFQLSSCFGEVVFNTGMTGYQEICSDPSYAGQMLVFTYPEIGNVGLNYIDNESNFIHLKAIIARNISSYSSNWRSKVSLLTYIFQKQIPHIFGIDTRSLAKHLRTFGVTNGVLSFANNKSKFSMHSFKCLNSLNLISKVTTVDSYTLDPISFRKVTNISFSSYPENTNYSVSKQYRILIFDLGIKFSIIRKLLLLNCVVDIVPATYNYVSILKYKPNGILLSNGPGNPTLASYVINTVKKLIYFSNIPIFGICMGHQILNTAIGATTFKLKFGHRGINHPSGNHSYVEITSQNHGFAVNNNSLESINKIIIKSFVVKYFNLNDNTISASFHNKLPIFSVQYHPESNPGPHDSEYLFQMFIELIELVNSY